MNVEEQILDYLEKLWHVESDRATARNLLRETADLALFPTDLLMHYVALAPPLYNAGTRRFEMQRTPNLFPNGVVFNPGAFTSASIRSAADGLSGVGQHVQDLVPRDQVIWRVIGGIISVNGNSFVQLRQEGGSKMFFTGALTGNTPVQFAVPGNGIVLDAGKTIEFWGSTNVSLFFTFFVCEESDTGARGGV